MTSTHAHDLLRLLAETSALRGDELRRRLQLDAAQFATALSECAAYGVPVDADTEHRYHLPWRLELLDAERILAALAPGRRERVRSLEILPAVDSTNRYLSAHRAEAGFRACFAEYQSAGRGRGGKPWISPYAAGIWLSVQTRREAVPAALNQRFALAVASLLRTWGGHEIAVKWPNDIIWRRRYKVAGLLSEARIHRGVDLVCGIGLNVALPPTVNPPVEQPWTDLTRVLGHTPERNRCAGQLLDTLVAVLEGEQVPPAELLDVWPAFDILYNAPVTLATGRGPVSGIARGIDADGALLLAHGGKVGRYVDGEVSIRKQTTL